MASGTSPSLASRRKSSLRFKSTFVKDGPSALAQKRGLILPNMVAMGGGEEEDIDDDDVIIDRGLVYEQRRRQRVGWFCCRGRVRANSRAREGLADRLRAWHSSSTLLALCPAMLPAQLYADRDRSR